MVEIVVDYQNMQFMIRKHGKWTMDNPLPVEVQNAVILQIINDCARIIRHKLREQQPSDPDVQHQSAVH